MSSVDLSKFTGANDPREYLRQPFQLLDGICACNGHIAIWVPGTMPFDAPLASSPIEKTMVESRDCAVTDEWLAAADLQLPALDPCTKCNGKGKLHIVDCDDCDGEGWFTHGRHDYECKDCDGRGYDEVLQDLGREVSCGACSGSGHRETGVALDNNASQGINVRYLNLLRELPGAVMRMRGDERAIDFKFEGGFGVVAPMRLSGR